MIAHILKREMSESVYPPREVDNAIHKADNATHQTTTIKPEFDWASGVINTEEKQGAEGQGKRHCGGETIHIWEVSWETCRTNNPVLS